MVHGTVIRDGRVYVRTADGDVPVGRVRDILGLVGGPAWTIEYSDWHRDRYPNLDTGDEGLTVDVVDMMHAMTHGQAFVEALRALPVEPGPDDDVPPRLGFFVGRLLGELQTGLD